MKTVSLNLVTTALMLLAATAQADNTITVSGSGGGIVNINAASQSNSVIDIYQVGTGTAGHENQAGTNASPITQSGAGQTARVGQGANYSDGVWTGGAGVNDNVARINQNGASGDSASVYQATNGNTTIINQSAEAQTATVVQSGSAGNSVTLNQDGPAALNASIIQSGAAASTVIAAQAAANAYTLTVTQSGAGGHYLNISTSSGYNGGGVAVDQSGSANQAYISGMSGGTAAINQSGTNGYVNLQSQVSGGLTINQTGTNNALGITNYGVGASAGQNITVTQSGNGGAASYNPSQPSGPSYSEVHP
jgi:hypothetical protein